MVTGDNAITAQSIAKKCGILKGEEGELVMEGPEFRKLILDANNEIIQSEFDKIWPKLRVLARSSPTDKYHLVGGLIESKLFPDRQIVAVTGDGTNDAPALKRSDVGFAMGITGTAVAQEACDIILMDDNFTSIVQAVKWGRNVYDSVGKFLQFQLTVNVVAIVVVSAGAVILKDPAMTAVQLLWVNLIMDSLASLALATEPPTDILLKRHPYPFTQPLVSGKMARFILGHSLYQCIVAFTIIFVGDKLLDVPSGRLGDQANVQCFDLAPVVDVEYCLGPDVHEDCVDYGTGNADAEAALLADLYPDICAYTVNANDESDERLEEVYELCPLTCGMCIMETEASAEDEGLRRLSGSSSEEKVAREPTVHYTMVFNSFVCMQAVNIVNARNLHGERNVLAGLFKNSVFVVILVGIILVQILLIQFGGSVMSVTTLNVEQWLICIVIGLGELIWHQLILFIPVPDVLFGATTAPEAGSKPLLSKQGSVRYNNSLARQNSMSAVGKETEKFKIQQSGKEMVVENIK